MLVTASVTLTKSQRVIDVDATAGDMTITLCDSRIAEGSVAINRLDSTSSVVTLAVVSNGTINTRASLSLPTAILLVPNGGLANQWGYPVDQTGSLAGSGTTGLLAKWSATSTLAAFAAGTATQVLHGNAIWSGVAIADLTATGTPSSSTYLRGDNTWATISAGLSGSGTATYLPIFSSASVIADSGVLYASSALSPVANDGAALGTTALKWSDIFLASGAVLNFNSGNVTITHTAGNLAISGIISSPGVGATSERFGLQSSAAGSNASAFGYQSRADGNQSVAFGFGAWAKSTNCISILGTTDGSSSMAFGLNTTATGDLSVSLGGTNAYSGSMVLGIGSTATAINQVVIGFGSTTYDYRHVYWGRGVTYSDPTGTSGGITHHSTAGAGTDITGANFTVSPGEGTGSGAGGSFIVRTAPAGSTGTTLGTLATRLTIDSTGLFTIGEACQFAFGTTTGTKFGTAMTQKMGWWNATPVVQPTAVADASGGAIIDAEARSALNGLLSRMRTIGLLAT